MTENVQLRAMGRPMTGDLRLHPAGVRPMTENVQLRAAGAGR